MFRACSRRVPGMLLFALILLKNWGLLRACSGRVVFYQIFTLAAAYNAERPLFLDFFQSGIAKNNNILGIKV